MNFIDAFSSIELKKLVRRYEAGQFLFQQGQMGQTMFIILDGRVDLIADRDGEEHVVLSLGSGEFMGEKSLIKGATYQRSFGAKSQITTTAVEIGMKDIETIRKTNPAGMVDILSRVFQLAITRLEKMNHLVRTLRGSNNHSRCAELILFFSKTAGTPNASGKREFSLSEESIHYHIDMEPAAIHQTLEDFIKVGALERTSENRYCILDESKLIANEGTTHAAAAA